MKIEKFGKETEEMLLDSLIKTFEIADDVALVFPIMPKNISSILKKKKEREETEGVPSTYNYVSQLKKGTRDIEPPDFFIKKSAVWCPNCCKTGELMVVDSLMPINMYTRFHIENGFQRNHIPSACPKCGAKTALIAPQAIQSEYQIGGFNNAETAFLNGHNMYYNIKGNFEPMEKAEILFVRESFEHNGIEGARVKLKFVYDEEKDEARLMTKITSVFDFNPDGEQNSYRKLKSGWKEYDLLITFGINGKILGKDIDVLFYGYRDAIDFIVTNTDFAKRTGLDTLFTFFSKKDDNVKLNVFFLFYLYLMKEFPVIELLIKAGNNSFVNSLVQSFLKEGQCKKHLWKKKIDEYEKLINQTTKASKALSLPEYIWDFLDKKQADVSEYVSWTNIFERTHISKEGFETFVKSEFYMLINFYEQLDRLPEILKYGYTLPQVGKYYREQKKRNPDMIITGFMSMFGDFLNMAEQLEMEVSKYPSNIKEAHDEVTAAFSAKQNEEQDAKLAAIADLYSGYKTTSKYLDVIVPRSTNEFVQEGINNHNCVAGYATRVVNGDCRIFFIRKIDERNKSYITAQCLPGGRLGQIFYRNNTSVLDKTERAYAAAFCKFIGSRKWEPDN